MTIERLEEDLSRRGSANTQDEMLRFCEELIALSRATAPRGQAGQSRFGVLEPQGVGRLEQIGWDYSIWVRLQKGIREAVEQVDEQA